MANNMIQRILFALVAIPVALGAIWYGGPVLAGLLALAAALGARELLNFARQQGVHPWRAAAIGLAAAFPLVAWRVATGANQFAEWPYALPVLLGLVLIHALWRVGPSRKPLTSAAVTLFTPMYAGGMLAFAMLLRHGAGYPDQSISGLLMVMFPVALTWGCDTAAMEVGRRLGGPKLAPSVSPGKTWSGAIGGLLAALALAPLLQRFVLAPQGILLTAWQALAIGAMVGVLGQVGDLAESVFKREIGAKDSSHLLPGHGGVLDRLDSLYFVIPLSAVLYHIFGLI